MQGLPLEKLTRVDGTSEISVCIRYGCPRPSNSHSVPHQQRAESPAFVLTLVGREYGVCLWRVVLTCSVPWSNVSQSL